MQNIDIALKVFSLCYVLQIILCDKVTILKIRCADFVIKGNYEPCIILLSVQAVGCSLSRIVKCFINKNLCHLPSCCGTLHSRGTTHHRLIWELTIHVCCYLLPTRYIYF